MIISNIGLTDYAIICNVYKTKKMSAGGLEPGISGSITTCPSLSQLRYTSRHISVIKRT